MTIARMYWDSNVAGATNLILLNGNVGSAINQFINATPISTFPTPGSHTINVQVMEANMQYSPAFTTHIEVESPASFTRIISASLGRAYWDSNVGAAVGLIILNGNAGNALNQFVTASPLSTFSAQSSHKLNVQLLDPNGSSNYGPVFSTRVQFDSLLQSNRIISAALGRAYWDNNIAGAVGLIILNGNAGNAVNEFVTATPPSTFSAAGPHTLNVQLNDPNGLSNFSPPFKTIVVFENELDSVRTIRVDAARMWYDNNIGAAVTMLAFDGNFNDAIETALQTMPAPAVGLHTISVQVRDSVPSQWGPAFKTTIIVEGPISYRNINVATGQLYWDNDTLNNPVTLLAFDGAFDNAIEAALKDSLPVLSTGLHHLCVRFKDVANNWSNPFRLAITIEDSLFARDLKVTQGEVRVDNSPPITIVSLNGNYNEALEQAQATIISSGIPVGLHRLIFRFKGLDGNWGRNFTTAIVVSPCASTPFPSVTNSRPLQFCYGDSTVLTAGSGYNSYQWIYNNTVVGTGQSFVARDSGIYVVIVTDNTDCPGSSLPIHVNMHNPQISISTPPTFCQGTISSLVATPGYPNYTWSGGVSSTNILNISAAGNYVVTATDAFGCSAQTSITTIELARPPIPVISASGSTALCAGSTVTLTSSATSNITWSNGLTTPSFTVDTAGYFTVTVTGANGCSSTSAPVSTTLFGPASASIYAGGPTTICDGNSVVLTANSSAAYVWSNGASGQSIAATIAGSYHVTITDSNGCTAVSAPITITVNPLPPVPVISNSGPLTFCNGGSVTLTSSATTNNTWSNGATTQSQTIYQSGTYVDTVTNIYGCKSWSAPIIVDAHPTASISANGPTTFCFGESVILTASPSSGVTYAWSTGATTPSITVSSTTNASVIVTETGTGCKDTAFANVLVHPLPTGTLVANGPTTVCYNEYVSLSASGSANTKFRWFYNGSPIVNYYYYNPCSCYIPYFTYGTSLNVNTSGNYSVEIIDTLTGCISYSNTIAATIVLPAQPVITANGGTTLCIGANTVLSSTPAVSYLWSTGETTQTIIAATQGTYQVTITDINGCTRSSAATPVTFYPTAQISANGPTTFCQGSSVNLTASPVGTYAWTNGSTAASITNITSSGTYGVTVTDANGCTSTAPPVNVVVNPLPTGSMSAAGVTTFCSGNTVTFNASGSANTKFRWYINGSPIVYYVYSYLCNCNIPVYTFGNSYTTGSPGLYSAEIIDTLTGCISMTNAIPVSVLSLPIPSITQTSFIPCNGGNQAALQASASGTVAPYTFLWSTGSGNSAISNLTAGNYQVTATDLNGCSASTNYTVQQPAIVTANAYSPANTRGYNVSCYGSTDGSATVYPAGGTAPYTYQWSTGATTATINNIGVGTYSVIVTDANTCATATASVTLVGPAPVGLTLSPSVFYGGSNISCNGGSNGSIAAMTSGGTASFTYAWSNGQTTQTATNLAAGTYSVIVTDSVGCTTTSAITLNEPAALGAVISVNQFNGYQVSCHGSTDGSINLTPNGGTAPYHMIWSDNSTLQNRTSMGAGTYSVTIYDTLGCSYIDSAILNEPTAITALTTGSMLTCYGDSNGVAGVTVSGGDGPYTYLWQNGQTAATATQLKANYYLVTITDSRGCTQVAQAQVQQPTKVVAYAFGTYIGCGSQIGLLSVTGTGGNGPYTFAWSNGSTASFQTNQALGTYSVMVTDTQGCFDTSTAIILSPPPLSATTTNYQTTCDSIITVPQGSVTVTASGGVTPYIYLWSNGETTPTISNLGTGDYTVIVTDANGCTVTPTAIVRNNDAATILGDSILCIGFPGGTLSSIPALAYTWSNTSGVLGTAQNLPITLPGTYHLTATNLLGCTNSDSVIVTSQQCDAILNLKLLIQGYYLSNATMVPVMMNQGVGTNANLTDTITVEVRETQAPYGVVASLKALLQTDGTATCVFPPLSGHYYIAVKHRNALQTWSADSLLLGPTPANYDFTTAITKAYGNSMIQVENGIWAFFSGDVNLDENIDLADLGSVDMDIFNFAYGYEASDLNGDGNVDLLDTNPLEDNIPNYIFSIHP
jgi:hypothetical protein